MATPSAALRDLRLGRMKTGAEAAIAIPAVIGGVGAISSGKGGKGGSSQAELPLGFKRASQPFGRLIGQIVRDPRFAGNTLGGGASGKFGTSAQRGERTVGGAVGQGLDFFSTLGENPDINASLDVLRQNVEDPTRLTLPAFQEARERFVATVNEQARGRGGLFSTGAQDRLARELGTFENQFISQSVQRQLASGEALRGAQLQLGQARFFPFQQIASAIPGLGGSTVLPPEQFNNQKSQNLFGIGSALGGVNFGGKGGTGTSSAFPTSSTNPSGGGPI